MRTITIIAPLAAACLGLSACGETETSGASSGDTSRAVENAGDAFEGPKSPYAAFPSGARIVQEDDVTYRVDPDGTRVRLGDADSRIVVEDGTRYRVDPDGSRVRIDHAGDALDDGTRETDGGINRTGNADGTDQP